MNRLQALGRLIVSKSPDNAQKPAAVISPKGPSRPFPGHSLEKSLVIVQAIGDKGAGKPMDRLLVADAVGRTPSSSEFKALLSSSLRYGLTTGTEKADTIAPTELGLQIVKPESAEQRSAGIVRAVLTPDIMKKIFEHFNRNKYPETSFLKNTLEKSFSINPAHSSELAERLSENGNFAGLIQTISGSKYVRIDGAVATAASDLQESNSEAQETDDQLDVGNRTPPLLDEAFSPPAEAAKPEPPKQLFIAHGKNHKPLDDLKKVLVKFGIAFKVAVDEAHAGRPISAKVAALMRECSAGIFIFTKDELFHRKGEDGSLTEVWRPSENVVYELGAASILWQKNIILREEGVTFPSDFSDLGYITFQNGEIGNRGMELLSEFVALGLVKIQAV